MPQSLACLYVHIIYSTRDRTPLLTPVLRPRLYEYCAGILRSRGAVLASMGGTADHVHLLLSFGRELAVAEAVRLVKANSSKWIHETFPAQSAFGWQAGYAAFSVSWSGVAKVRAYIENQEEHHKGCSFQEELRLFLRRHQVAFDERYVWD